LGQVGKSSTFWTATFRSHWQTVQLLKVVPSFQYHKVLDSGPRFL